MSDKHVCGATDAIAPQPVPGAYLCESTEKNANYWLKAARESEQLAEQLILAEQAINAWRNLAYALAKPAHYYQLQQDGNASVSAVTTSPHIIADNVSDEEKAMAFEWLRQHAVGGNRLAAVAQDEWHRCREAETSRLSTVAISETEIEDNYRILATGLNKLFDSDRQALQRNLRELRDAAMRSLPSAIQRNDRPCTCHPDDNPPVPCPRKYALAECRAAAKEKT